MRTYELMTIFRPEMAEPDVRAQVSIVESALGEHGSEVKGSDFWGKRRFAYEIQHLTEGYYIVTTFDGEPDAVAYVDRALSLSDQVIRHKFVRPE